MKALLLDTHSLFFRAFYALPPMNTRAGLATNALYGFSVQLLKLLREERPDTLAFAADLPEKTFRHGLYAAYKAGRPRAPDALREQLALLPRLVSSLGVPLISAVGFEADDVLATLARQLTQVGAHVLVVSGDRDLLQLVDENTDVLFVGQRGKPPIRYDVAAVHARFGLPPARLPSYIALVGDTADNIPKLKGVGEATARAWLTKHADIDALIDDASQLENTRLRTLVLENAAQLRESETLARLRFDVPIAEDSQPHAIDRSALGDMAALFEEWEFKSLIPRLKALV